MAAKTKLMRDALCALYQQAQDAHPGLLLQRGLREHEDNDSDAKTKTSHIGRVCGITPDDFYRHAYERWRQATTDAERFRQVPMKIEHRLFIDLTGGGMLETGCAISHSYGAPYIPGASIKGAVAASTRERLADRPEGPAICDELFGMPATEDQPGGWSGLMTFHDAWWTPASAPRPLVQEVVTTHHPDYYGKEGEKPATDFDSPVPNAQVAVQGAFLFVIEGPTAWLDFARSILIEALVQGGLGAKTRSGYGTMRFDEEASRRHEAAAAELQRERRKKQVLEEVTKDLPEDAVWVEERRIAETWSATNAFLDDTEDFLKDKQVLSQEAYTRLAEELERRWFGILTDPNAVKGKRNKPKYRPRPRALAEWLLALKRNEEDS